MKKNLIIACAAIAGAVALSMLRDIVTTEYDISDLDLSEIEAEDELTYGIGI